MLLGYLCLGAKANVVYTIGEGKAVYTSDCLDKNASDMFYVYNMVNEVLVGYNVALLY